MQGCRESRMGMPCHCCRYVIVGALTMLRPESGDLKPPQEDLESQKPDQSERWWGAGARPLPSAPRRGSCGGRAAGRRCQCSVPLLQPAAAAPSPAGQAPPRASPQSRRPANAIWCDFGRNPAMFWQQAKCQAGGYAPKQAFKLRAFSSIDGVLGVGKKLGRDLHR